MSDERDAEMCGFDDATELLLYEMHNLPPNKTLPWDEALRRFYRAPEPSCGPDGPCQRASKVDELVDDCPRCQYALGWTEGLSK